MKAFHSKTSSICIVATLFLFILAVAPISAELTVNGTNLIDIFELGKDEFFSGVTIPVGDVNSTFYLVLWDE